MSRSTRSVFVIICLILVMHPASAGKLVLESYASTGITINALLGEFQSISITPVVSDGLSVGIPFSITGSDVLATTQNTNGSLNGYGRQIAIWSVVMNGTGGRGLSIKADPLMRVIDNDGRAVSPDNPIEYWLSFCLSYRAYEGGIFITKEGYLGVYGNGVSQSFTNNFDNFTPVGTDSPFVSQDQSVRIIFVKSTGEPYSREEVEAWKAGIYSADITITVGGS